MNIQVNTDNNISGSDELIKHLEDSLSTKLKRYDIAITRIEVHLSQSKEGKRCQIEARISSRPSVIVSYSAGTLHLAMKTAIEKLLRSLDSMIGKMADRKSSKELFKEESLEIETDIETE